MSRIPRKQQPPVPPKPRSPNPSKPMIRLPMEAFEAGRERPPAFLQELEKKKKFHLAHEQGAGNPCNKCGEECPGFDLHFWRKVCRHCKCGKQEHNVADQDNFHVVERLLGPRDKTEPQWIQMQVSDGHGNSENNALVQYAWIPPGVTVDVAKEYMQKIPIDKQPIQGSEGAKNRSQQLERQVPAHDLDESLCHALSPEEKQSMQDYVENLKQNAVGQGMVRICTFSIPSATATSVSLDHSHHPPPAPFLLSLRPRSPMNQSPSRQVYPKQNHSNQLPVQTQSPPSPDWPPPPPLASMGLEDDDEGTSCDPPTPPPVAFASPELKPSHLEPPNYPPPPPPPQDITVVPEKEMANLRLEDGKELEAYECLDAKDWHKEVSPELRKHLIHKIMQSIVPSPSELQEKDMQKLVTFAKQIESNMFQVADSLEQYYHLVAEKMYLFQKEIEERKEKEQLQQEEGSARSEQGQLFVAEDMDNSFCHTCKVPLQNGDVVVLAERAGKQSWWHPQCFCCHICQELLVDLIYFHHKGNLYCGRHYAEAVNIPRCHACDELIFAKEYTMAGDATYHVKHFCCFSCDNPLADQKYVVMEEQPHCLPCYQRIFGKNCRTCNKAIGPEEQRLSHGNLHFHASDKCFRCDTCGMSLIGGRFLEKNGQIFCSKECKMNFI